MGKEAGVDYEQTVRKAEQKRRYYEAHRDEIRAKQAEYRAANREKVRECKMRYIEEHRDAINARYRWRYKHDAKFREHEDERHRAYRDTEQYRAWHAEYERKRYHAAKEAASS